MLASTRDPRFSTGARTPLKNSPLRYELICATCGTHHWDDGVRLVCRHQCTGLLQSRYLSTAFTPRTTTHSLGRYEDWLPGFGNYLRAPLPAVTQFSWLNARLQLPNLHVLVSGFWPRGPAALPTGSFKDLEADAVFARLRLAPQATVVLASAGNTALAFAAAATERDAKCVIVTSAQTRATLQLRDRVGPGVRFVTVTGDARYDDAIRVSQRLADGENFVLEGGVKNIARRDGVAAAFLRAVEVLGEMPAIYVQGVGSAAGALAVNEAAGRLVAAGRGATRPRLFLVQNAPFTPLVRSWQAQAPQLLAEADDTARRQVAQLAAPVLSNLKPPYAIDAGIYHALQTSHGEMLGISNGRIENACREFYTHENVILDPAAAAALAALEVVAPLLRATAGPVLLHLTGAKPLDAGRPIPTTNDVTIDRRDIEDDARIELVRQALLQ